MEIILHNKLQVHNIKKKSNKQSMSLRSKQAVIGETFSTS